MSKSKLIENEENPSLADLLEGYFRTQEAAGTANQDAAAVTAMLTARLVADPIERKLMEKQQLTRVRVIMYNKHFIRYDALNGRIMETGLITPVN